MKTLFRAVLVAAGCAAFAGPSWAQRGIPIPRISPPRIPVFHPVPIHGPSQGQQKAESHPPNPAVVTAVVSGIAAIVVLVIAIAAWRNRTVARLRVARTPPGEAPEEVRVAWVGVALPLRRWELKPAPHPTEGVLSRHLCGVGTGYAVSGPRAVKTLAAHSRDAAAWWRRHAPHVLERGYRLWFPLHVFEPLEELALGADGKGGLWQRDAPPWEK
jgi:hypothetical protein